MSQVHSFSPLSDINARVLILGSMPGKASLRDQQYYAHPRNVFWPLMATILGIDLEANYVQRCQQLISCGVGVWDVLQTCTRTSSLDSDIVKSSVIINDFQTFLHHHSDIRAIYFNGATAEKFYLKHVLEKLPLPLTNIPLKRLPSTSPAHAAVNFEAKLYAWRDIEKYL